MTPEDFSEKRPTRLVHKTGPAEVLYCADGSASLLRCRNARGSFEVLVAADRVAALVPAIVASEALSLSGYWRRRSSGYRKDGSRNYIWTLVLLDVAEAVTSQAA